MDIKYSKQSIKFLNKQDKPTKIRWDNVPKELPDKIDLAMLDEIENNPDCREFVSSDEAMRLIGLN